MIIYLIGFMGSGKSTAGKKLSSKLNVPFYDLDAELTKACGLSVREMFEQKGEAWFREKEHSLLRTLSEKGNAVIACGGGTPCFYNNMEFMNATGVTVYLKMSAKSLLNRLLPNQDTRPLIAGKSPVQLHRFITESLEKREDFYNKASFKVKALDLNVEELARLVK